MELGLWLIGHYLPFYQLSFFLEFVRTGILCHSFLGTLKYRIFKLWIRLGKIRYIMWLWIENIAFIPITFVRFSVFQGNFVKVFNRMCKRESSNLIDYAKMLFRWIETLAFCFYSFFVHSFFSVIKCFVNWHFASKSPQKLYKPWTLVLFHIGARLFNALLT